MLVRVLPLCLGLLLGALVLPAPAQEPPAEAPPLRPFRVASDYPSIQAAIDSLPEMIGGTVYIPEGRWVLEETLDLSGRNYHTMQREAQREAGMIPRTNSWVHLLGAGHGTILEGRMTEGAVLDMTDSSYCVVSNLRIESRSAQCGILLARPHPKNRQGVLLSAGWHTFYSVWVTGSYSVAAVYNQASEVNRWYGCTFQNMHPDAHGFVFTYRNFAGLVSPGAGELCEIGSNADQRLHGCLFMIHPQGAADPENPEGAAIYIQGWAEDFSLIDCDFGVSGVKATVWIDGTRNPCKQIHILNNRFENSATYLLLADGYNLQVSFRDNTCYGAGRNLIRSTGRAEMWDITGNLLANYEAVNTPAMWFNTLVNSTVGRNWALFNETDDRKGTTPHLVVEGGADGLDLVLPRRADFQGQLTRSRLTALDEEGVRREYLGAAGGPTLLNLAPVDTSKLAAPQKGDVAMDDGTNTASKRPGLAVFDGEQWQYTN